jgi:molecular chaperone GrpE
MGEDKQTPVEPIDGETEQIEFELLDDDTQDIPAPDEKEDGGAEEDHPVDLGPSVEAEIERLEKDLDSLRDVHLRKLAEFDNFRKRTDREREEFRRIASEDLVAELLPVLDNFERALEHGPESDSTAFREGVEMIAKQLWDTLVRQGVEAIDPLGEQFSPEYHEAVHRIEDPDEEPGTIAMVMAKGYSLNGRLIRPAMVGVVAAQSGESNGESNQAADDSDE